MKKVFLFIAMMAMTLAANAQFEKGKTFVDAELTGLNLSYNGTNKFQFGINAKMGQFMTDNWLLYGQVGYKHIGQPKTNDFNLGVGGRYYFLQNGVFMGLNAKYVHGTSNYNDVMPALEVGYAFFISRNVTIEPSVYYEQSFSDHSNRSTVGLKIGLGLYHAKDKIKNSVKAAFEPESKQ